MSKVLYIIRRTCCSIVVTLSILMVFLSCTENNSLDLSSIGTLIIFLWIFGSIIYKITRYFYTIFLTPYYFTKRQCKKQLRISSKINDFDRKQKNTYDLLWLEALYSYELKIQPISSFNHHYSSSEINRNVRKSLAKKTTQEVKPPVHLDDNDDFIRMFSSIIWNKLLVFLPDTENPIEIDDECLPVPKDIAIKIAAENGFDISVVEAVNQKEFPKYKYRNNSFYKNIVLKLIPSLHLLSIYILFGIIILAGLVFIKLDLSLWIKIIILIVSPSIIYKIFEKVSAYIGSFFMKLKHKYAFKNFGLNGRSLKILGRNSLVSFDQKKTSFVTIQPIIVEISDSSVEISEFFSNSYKIHLSKFIYPSKTSLFLEGEKLFLSLDFIKKEVYIYDDNSSLNYLRIHDFEIISFK